MTTHREKRCRHCGQRYSFTASGPGCDNRVNNDRYCRSCQGEILVTLRKLPIRVKLEWVEVEQPTVEMCEAWEKEWAEEHAAHDPPHFLPYGRRILPCLFDMNDMGNVNYVGIVQGRGEFKGRQFRYSTWTKKPENNTVKVAMEWNMETGDKTAFWRDL